MKTKLITICFLFIASLSFAATASAHVLKTDGNMGIVLHIDPDDAPVAEAPATMIFLIKDKQPAFKLSACTCQLTVSANGQQLFSQALTAAVAEDTAVVPYTFPQKAVYAIVVDGQPSGGASFDKFHLEWDWRVDQQAAAAATTAAVPAAPTFWQEHWLHVSLLAAAVLANILILLRNRKKGKKKAVKPGTALIVMLVSSSFLAHTLAHPDLGNITGSMGDHPCCVAAVADHNPVTADVAVAEVYIELHDDAATASVPAPILSVDNKSPPENIG